MNLKKSFSRNSLIRLALLIASVAVMLLVMPRADHQSFTYELNQPWKYQLLTAPADMPILRDSTSLRRMRDSIDRSFIPCGQDGPRRGPHQPAAVQHRRRPRTPGLRTQVPLRNAQESVCQRYSGD